MTTTPLIRVQDLSKTYHEGDVDTRVLQSSPKDAARHVLRIVHSDFIAIRCAPERDIAFHFDDL